MKRDSEWISRGLAALRAGHWPSLVGGWLHFELSFMVWLLFGALSIPIAEAFGLTATEKGLLVAVPLLGGAGLRVVIGPLADRYGPKVVGLWLLLLQGWALLSVWLWGSSYSILLGLGIMFGVAGASFAVALPIASHAYPSAHQGFAMGVVAIGNSGALLASLIMPICAAWIGWRHTFGVMAVPVLCTAMIFAAMVKGRRVESCETGLTSSIIQRIRETLRHKFMYWLCFLYAVTFGGFVGLSSLLPVFFHDQFHVDMVMAGLLTAICGLMGSVARPIGGFLADRWGGGLLLQVVLPTVALLCGAIGVYVVSWGVVPLLMMSTFLLGFGNGVVFQLAARRFRNMMGTASGLIGAAGALGGFMLPSWFGLLKDVTGSFAGAFWLFGVVAAVAGISAMMAQRSGHPSVQHSV